MGINNFGENTQNNEKINVKYDFSINKKNLDYALEHLEEGAEPREGNSSQFEIGEYSYTDLEGKIKKDTITVKMFLNKVYVELDGTYIFDDIDTQININGDNIVEKIRFLLNKYIQKEVIKPQAKNRIKHLKKEVNNKINTKKQISETKKDISKIKNNLFETDKNNKNDEEKNTPAVIIEKENKPKIKFSSEKYNNDFKIFKDYCEKNNLNTEEELHRIQQKEMDNVSKDELMYFGPKTINYINSNIYKKENKEYNNKTAEKEIIPVIISEDIEKKDLKIILSSEKYSEDLEDFKMYCKKIGKKSEDVLYHIHTKKLNVSKDNLMYFGPSTIKFLDEKIYKTTERLTENTNFSELKRNFLNKLEKEKNNSITLDINSKLKEINNFLINSHSVKEESLRNNLKKVKSKLLNLKNNGKTKFKVYSEALYNYKDVNNFLENHFTTIYGNIKWKNIEGTYITKGLDIEAKNCSKLNGKSKNNDAYIVKQNEKYILYYFKNGKLSVATYISPGKVNGIGGGYSLTKKGSFNLGSTDINHISNNFRGFTINKEGKIVGWSMLNSRRFYGGQALHVSSVVTTKRESHGCVRTPIFYSIALGQYKNIKLHILDN